MEEDNQDIHKENKNEDINAPNYFAQPNTSDPFSGAFDSPFKQPTTNNFMTKPQKSHKPKENNFLSLDNEKNSQSEKPSNSFNFLVPKSYSPPKDPFKDGYNPSQDYEKKISASSRWNNAYSGENEKDSSPFKTFTIDSNIFAGITPPQFASSPIKDAGYEDLPQNVPGPLVPNTDNSESNTTDNVLNGNSDTTPPAFSFQKYSSNDSKRDFFVNPKDNSKGRRNKSDFDNPPTNNGFDHDFTNNDSPFQNTADPFQNATDSQKFKFQSMSPRATEKHSKPYDKPKKRSAPDLFMPSEYFQQGNNDSFDGRQMGLSQHNFDSALTSMLQALNVSSNVKPEKPFTIQHTQYNEFARAPRNNASGHHGSHDKLEHGSKSQTFLIDVQNNGTTLVHAFCFSKGL